MSQANVYVTEDQATAEVKIFLEDLYLFHNLEPDEQDFLAPAAIQRGIKLHRKFISERFELRDGSGERIAGKLIGVKQSPELPSEGVHLAQLMAYGLTFELRYSFPEAPEFLTFSHQFTDEYGILPSEMKLFVKQAQAEDWEEAQLRPGAAKIIRFDWHRPPPSSEASEEIRRQWQRQQQEATLGITSYSSVYSFLYIDDTEVRHEVLVPLLALDPDILPERNEDPFLDLEEQQAAREGIERYFVSGNPIEVNGRRITPEVQRCDFYGLDFKDFARQTQPKQVALVNARVGIILSYPLAETPKTVQLTWDRFSRSIWAVDTVVFAYETTEQTTLSRLGNQNTYLWENPGRPPRRPIQEMPAVLPPEPVSSQPWLALGLLALTLSLVLLYNRKLSIRSTVGLLLIGMLLAWLSLSIKTPLLRYEMDESYSREVVSTLLQNLYRAFELEAEEEIYDGLAKSAHGDLLRDVYLQIRQGLIIQEQGGAVSDIRDVSLLELDPQTESREEILPNGFTYRCRWNVSGTVEHWGHIHERTNQYDALLTVEPVGKAWKVTHINLLDEQRVHAETRLRGL